jgi:hypothetical protein
MKLLRPRFGLRTLLGLVTVAAIIAAFGPRLYRRFQADRGDPAPRCATPDRSDARGLLAALSPDAP